MTDKLAETETQYWIQRNRADRLQNENNTLRLKVDKLRVACALLVELDETDETHWPPSLRKPVALAREALKLLESQT